MRRPTRPELTDRARRWATREVGKNGRTITEVAGQLDCDRHSDNGAVLAYGAALDDHPERFGDVNALEP